MKALLSTASGGPSTLIVGNLPDPVPGRGQVVIDVKACAVNFPDSLIIEDRYQFRPARPFSPGAEVAGVVSLVGDGVSSWKPGDRVIGVSLAGGMAEKMLIGEGDLVPLPEGRGFIESAALLFTYGTTIYALKDRGRIKPGAKLLVLGAGGGIGLSAIQLGKAFGATVVAAASSAEKVELARKAGADEAIVYPAGPLDRAQVKQLTDAFKAASGGTGFDIVYDPVGGDYSEAALRAIAWEGRFLIVGFPAGIAHIPLNLPLLKSCDVCGVFWGEFRRRYPDANRQHFSELFDLWEAGKIAPHVTEVFPLDRGGEAIARLAARQATGKLVVEIGA